MVVLSSFKLSARDSRLGSRTATMFVRLQDPGFAKQTEKEWAGILLHWSLAENLSKMSTTLLTHSSTPQKKNYQNRPNLGLSWIHFTINTISVLFQNWAYNFPSFLVVRIGIKICVTEKNVKMWLLEKARYIWVSCLIILATCKYNWYIRNIFFIYTSQMCMEWFCS